MKKYGKEYAQEHLQEMEKQAYCLENVYYHIFKKEGIKHGFDTKF